MGTGRRVGCEPHPELSLERFGGVGQALRRPDAGSSGSQSGVAGGHPLPLCLLVEP